MAIAQDKYKQEVFDSIKCTKGKKCSEICIPKKSRCKSEGFKQINRLGSGAGNLTAKSVGTGLLVGGVASGVGLSAAHVARTINVQKTPANNLSLLTQEEVDKLKPSGDRPEQGARGGIFFVEDESGKRSLFKEIHHPLFYLQASAEALVSDIAQEAGINTNKVKLVPAALKTPLKTGRFGASLHTVVPGKTLTNILKENPSSPYATVNIKQENGLTKGMIQALTKHSDLAKLAALDTFTGNWDRKNENLFYDSSSNSFHAIDNGESFGKTLAKDTYNNLKNVDFTKLDPKELSGLETYNETLKQLYKNRSPEKNKQDFTSYLSQEKGDWNIARRYLVMTNIDSNYKNTKKLTDLIDAKLREVNRKDSGIQDGRGTTNKYKQEVFDSIKCVKGKKCGERCIPKSYKCRDEQPSIRSPKLKTSGVKMPGAFTTSALISGGVTGAVLTAGIVAIAKARAVRREYIAGFKVSGEIAQKEAEKIEAPRLEKNIKTGIFTVGGFGTPDAFSESARLQENIKSLELKDIYTEPISYAEFNVANNPKRDGAHKALAEAATRFIEVTTQKKHNPVARKLAAKVLAYQKANPDVEFQLVGHSGGGLTVQETNEILQTLGVKVRTTAIGSPDVGIIPGTGDVVTAASKQDYIVNGLGGRAVNKKSFDNVDEHGQDAYFADKDFRQFMTDRLKSSRQDRMDKAECKEGKPCGDICIPKKSVCRKSGQSAQLKTPGSAAIGVAGALAGGLGVSAATIALARERYRRNLPESVNMAREKASKIDPKSLKNFDDKEQITFFQTGFTGGGGNVRRLAYERKAERVVQEMFPSHGVVVRENKDFNIAQIADDPDPRLKPDDPGFYQDPTPQFVAKFLGKAAQKTVGTFLVTGRNPEAVNLAAEAYAYHQKYPKKPINIIGHSAGGIIAPEAANILKELKVPTKVVNIGGPDFGVIDYPDYKAFASKKDPITGLFPNSKASYINEVKSHNYSAYLLNPSVNKEITEFFNKNKSKSDSYIDSRELVLKKYSSGTFRNDARNSRDLLERQFQSLISRAYNKTVNVGRIKASPNGEISGLFKVDGKTYSFTYRNENLAYQLAVGKRFDSVVIRLDAKSKRKRCKVGIACGSTCIESKDVCKLKVSSLATPSEKLQLNQAIARFKLEQDTQPQQSKQEDYIVNPETGKNYTIRELRKVAASKGVVGYGSMPMDEMRSAIQLVDKDPESARRIVVGVARRRSLGTRAIAVSGLSGRNKNEREAKRRLKDAVATNKRLEALIKFTGSAPIAWTAGAVGAFLLGTTIRTYERTREKYREGFDESAKLAEERAVKLRLINNISQDNITFAVGSGKGHGAEEIKKLLQRENPDNEGDRWLAKSNYVIPFDLQETGINKKSNETGSGDEILDGMKNYLQTFRRGSNQDAIDLAANLYAYGIQRKISNPPELKNKYKKINVVAHGMGGQTAKEALELLSRMDIKGSPSGKEVLKQINVVNLGTPHFGFAENLSRRHRTIISAQDPVSNIPGVGSGARKQWISSVKGHSVKDYLEDNRVRDAIREAFGYYEGGVDELSRRTRKSNASQRSTKRSTTDAYEIQRESTLSDIKMDFLNQCSGGNKRCGDICLPPNKKCRLNYISNPKKYSRARFMTKLGRGVITESIGGLGQDLERAYLRTRRLATQLERKVKKQPLTQKENIKESILHELKLLGVQAGQGTISKKLKELDKTFIDLQESSEVAVNQLKESAGDIKQQINKFIKQKTAKTQPTTPSK